MCELSQCGDSCSTSEQLQARAQQDNLPAALSDLNQIRTRSGLSQFSTTSRNQLLLAIEQERRVELAFEGHRWFDLKRTGRVQEVMEGYSPNWNATDELWPINFIDFLHGFLGSN